MGFNIYVVSTILALWLLILTFLFWQLYHHYNNLVKGISQKTLKSLLEETLKSLDYTKKDIEKLKEQCDRIEKDGLFHIQKIGLLRFNPFKDTGGDQSFILALVDGNDTGVIISGLYSRSGTRWYAKKVVKGKGIDYDLSEEEIKALRQATKES